MDHGEVPLLKAEGGPYRATYFSFRMVYYLTNWSAHKLRERTHMITPSQHQAMAFFAKELGVCKYLSFMCKSRAGDGWNGGPFFHLVPLHFILQPRKKIPFSLIELACGGPCLVFLASLAERPFKDAYGS